MFLSTRKERRIAHKGALFFPKNSKEQRGKGSVDPFVRRSQQLIADTEEHEKSVIDRSLLYPYRNFQSVLYSHDRIISR